MKVWRERRGGGQGQTFLFHFIILSALFRCVTLFDPAKKGVYTKLRKYKKKVHIPVPVEVKAQEWDYQGDADIISFYYDQNPNKYEKSFLDDPKIRQAGYSLFFLFVFVIPFIIGCYCFWTKCCGFFIDNVDCLGVAFDGLLGRDRRFRPFRKAFRELGHPAPSYKDFNTIKTEIESSVKKTDVYG